MIVLQVSPTFDELKFKFENLKKIEFWKSEIINFENNKLPYTTCIYNTINILKSLKNTESIDQRNGKNQESMQNQVLKSSKNTENYWS